MGTNQPAQFGASSPGRSNEAGKFLGHLEKCSKSHPRYKCGPSWRQFSSCDDSQGRRNPPHRMRAISSSPCPPSAKIFILDAAERWSPRTPKSPAIISLASSRQMSRHFEKRRLPGRSYSRNNKNTKIPTEEYSPSPYLWKKFSLTLKNRPKSSYFLYQIISIKYLIMKIKCNWEKKEKVLRSLEMKWRFL